MASKGHSLSCCHSIDCVTARQMQQQCSGDKVMMHNNVFASVTGSHLKWKSSWTGHVYNVWVWILVVNLLANSILADTNIAKIKTSTLGPTSSTLASKAKQSEEKITAKTLNQSIIPHHIRDVQLTHAYTSRTPTIINIISPAKQNVSQRIPSSTSYSTTPAPTPAPTRKSIYHKGLLISREKPRTFYPALPEDTAVDDNDPVPQKHMSASKPEGEDACPPSSPDCDSSSESGVNIAYIGTPARRKKKHSSGTKSVFHNSKLLHDTHRAGKSNARGSTEFYAWIFGGAMLGVVCFSSLASCFVLKMRKIRAERKKRRWDRNGEYERVDSVSSIVDSSSLAPADLDDDQLDAVSII